MKAFETYFPREVPDSPLGISVSGLVCNSPGDVDQWEAASLSRTLYLQIPLIMPQFQWVGARIKLHHVADDAQPCHHTACTVISAMGNTFIHWRLAGRICPKYE